MADLCRTVEIDDAEIDETLAACRSPDVARVREVLSKALDLNGLDRHDAALLMAVTDAELLEAMFSAARRVKNEIYGVRLVLFAPLYVSNQCITECLYCAFRTRNKAVTRRTLGMEDIARETKALIDQGHKRLLLVSGEGRHQGGLQYVLDAIETIYSTKSGNAEIRRVNVNMAPLDTEGFRELKAARIGTYQVFQETYHRPTYRRMHVAGAKRDYDRRITAMDRAMEAGIDDVGIGVLFGLYDWKYEILALLRHVEHLEREFGVGPHTISVPRMEPAAGSEISRHPPYPVSDDDFRKLVAILRMAVPYTGIIMSTRETPAMRRETFALGVSQISAGSRTNPGGYCADERDPPAEAQFSLGDHRELDEVVRDVAGLGYIPSFCTACYRLGRTGEDFMDLAKPGEIKTLCEPNALATFVEYLVDYSSPETKDVGEGRIQQALHTMDDRRRAIAETLIAKVREGRRDVFT